MVTIVITSFNSAGFIRESIESALRQTCSETEVLIIDGASTDGTLAIIKEFETRVKSVSEPDNGETDALQKGLAMAKGEIVNFLNSDDLLEPWATSVAVGAFKAEPRVAMVYGDTMCCGADSSRKWGFRSYSDMTLDRLVNYDSAIAQAAGFFRKSCLDATGGWDLRYDQMNDLELWLRMLKRYPARHIPSVFATVRTHPQAKTQRFKLQNALESIKVRREYGGRLFCRANYRLLRALAVAPLARFRKKKPALAA